MAELRTQIERAEPSNGNTTDMRVTDFWEKVYLPRLEEIVALTAQPRRKRSTVRGFKQIWRQHLKAHFADGTLKAYEPVLGTANRPEPNFPLGILRLSQTGLSVSKFFGHR
jgi:hypothetical protein